MGNDFVTALRPALVLTLLFALLVGIAYPLAVLGVGQIVFPRQANGELVRDGDRVVGSELIGQAFTADRYFHGRPSAAGSGYDATASSGSNLGPTSKALHDRVAGDVAALRKGGAAGPVPVDMVTTSASGLDPHISPATAYLQVERVAKARGASAARIRALVGAAIERPFLGIFGEARVNLLALNRQLDAIGADRGG